MAVVLKITKPTFNVLTESDPKNFIFDSDLNHIKTSGSGSFQRTVNVGNSTTVAVAHGLGYKPLVLAYFRSTADNNWFISMAQIEPTNARGAFLIYVNVELYVDTTYVYFKINNFSGFINYTVEVEYEIFFEGS